jgi:hypothetical protein
MPVLPGTKQGLWFAFAQAVSRVVFGKSLNRAMCFSLARLAYHGQEIITSLSNGYTSRF